MCYWNTYGEPATHYSYKAGRPVCVWYGAALAFHKTFHKTTLYFYGIIIYSAVCRNEQPLKINTLFSEKVRDLSN